ncbi:MAG: hypothetical protein L6R30_16400 [Thermoanaerobaculia bacterium]|nr:hypothetical protein [Thermoanaerobaculia bacterium]
MVAKFTQVFPESGVDDDASPHPWMMVPRQAYNLALLVEPQGLRLSFDSSFVEVHELPDAEAVNRFGAAVLGKIWRGFQCAPEMVARGTAVMRESLASCLAASAAARALLVAVVPRRTGSCQVRAVDGQGALRAALDVSVKEERRYRLAFRFVDWGLDPAEWNTQDREGPVRTSRNVSELHFLLARVNTIFSRQVNVTFSQASVSKVGIQRHLTGSLMMSPHPMPRNAHEHHLLPHRDRTAGVTVFFVHEVGSLYHESKGSDLDAIYVHRHGILVMEDEVGAREDRILAHELGHFLQSRHGVLEGHQHVTGAPNNGHLMFDNSSLLSGARIAKEMANRMNP